MYRKIELRTYNFSDELKTELKSLLDTMKREYFKLHPLPELPRAESGSGRLKKLVDVRLYQAFKDHDPMNCSGETSTDKNELRRRMVHSLGGKEQFKKLVDAGWCHGKDSLEQPFTNAGQLKDFVLKRREDLKRGHGQEMTRIAVLEISERQT